MRRLCYYVNSYGNTRIYTDNLLIRKTSCKTKRQLIEVDYCELYFTENLHKHAHLMYSYCITRLFLRLTQASFYSVNL